VEARLTAEDGDQAQQLLESPEDACVVLTVDRRDDGAVSPYLVDELRPGDRAARPQARAPFLVNDNERENMTFQEIFALHPRPTELDHVILLRCIEECLDCAASCTACADASLSESDSQDLIGVVRRALDCADACEATGRVVARQSAPDLGLMRATVEACATTCLACAEECEQHAAHHEHCRVCADVCRRCKRACDDVLAAST
jgi:hypothetical protein